MSWSLIALVSEESVLNPKTHDSQVLLFSTLLMLTLLGQENT